MSQLRTVPGEDLSSRLSARGGSRARVGPQRSFYQRLGVSDPYGEEPEAEEIVGNGLFSFLSAQKYYRELRGQRLRMMWRLGAIRHRQVAGERLRAAGPSFAATNVLAGAALPTAGELVLLDPKVTPGATEEEETSLFSPRRRAEPARRARRSAVAATERSAGRSEPELARALAQLERLLAGQTRDRVVALAREIPGATAARRAEVVREVVRVVERETPRAATADRSERASRPLAVASERTRPLAAGDHTSTQGPRGLQPVLRNSPAVQASSGSLVERVARRPAAVERLVAEVRGSESSARTLGAPRSAEARRAPLADTVLAAPLAPKASDAAEPTAAPIARRRRDERPTERRLTARPVDASVPTARIARAAVQQAIPEAPGAPRGLEAGRPTGAPSLSRQVARAAAGDAAADTRAPVSGSATSWLSDDAHPHRRVTRALAAANPAVLRHEAPAAEATSEVVAPRSARRAEEAPARSGRRTAAAVEAAPVVAPRSADRADTSGPTLRAVSRALPDPQRVAASPIRVRVPPALTLPEPIARAEADAAPTTGAPRRRASGSSDPARSTRRTDGVGRGEGAAAPVGPSPSRRALERVDRADPARRAVAPLAEDVTSVSRPAAARAADAAAQPAPTGPRRMAAPALDLVALTPAAARDDQTATAAPRRRGRPVESAPEAAAPRRAASATAARAATSRRPTVAVETPTSGPVARAALAGTAIAAAEPRRAAPVADRADAPAPRRVRPEHRAEAPATRRALHRLAEPAAASERERVALTASPASFVYAARAQEALDAEPESEQAPTRDRSATRALARSTHTARVDDRDRARLAPAATDYLPVAAAAEALAASPTRAVRRLRDADAPSGAIVENAGRRLDDAAATTAEPRSRAAERAPQATWAAPLRPLASAAAAARGELAPGRLDLTDTTDVAIRPRRSRRDLPVADLRTLSAPPVQQADATAAPARPPRASLGASLRQVASAFRAAERDSVQVLTLDASRRAIGATSPSAEPTITATLERDATGQLVLARANRLSGEGAGEQVTLTAADLGEGLGDRAAPASGVVGRSAARADAAEIPARGAARAPRLAHGAASVLARAPLAWAEDRADASQERPAPSGVAASPVREAGRRWHRPVPEGPVALGAAPADEPGHRLTAPLAPRRRGTRPDLLLASQADGVEADAAEASESAPRRRVAHGANTWVDLEPAPGRSDRRVGAEARAAGGASPDGAPGWARRAVEPPVAERADHDAPGSRVRSGGGLLTALARAGDPEDIVRVILERSHETAALARELGGGAGSLLHEVAAAASAPDVATPARARAGRGETVESTTVSRGRPGALLGGGEGSRGVRTRTGATATSQGHDGVGASNVMKLASKLKKLIHLAEHERRLDDARAQVRMAEESASARAEVGAGKSGGQGLEDDNMPFERLREEILREVQHQLEMTKQRGDSDVGNGWW